MASHQLSLPLDLCAIPGYDGYFITRDGQIYSVRKRGTLEGLYDTPRPISPRITDRGYKRATLYRNGKPKSEFVHRLVLNTFVGPPPSDKHVSRHLNGRRQDNRVENLEWSTQKENLSDRIRHGTAPWGEENPNASICEQDVREIRTRYDSGEAITEIADQFNMSYHGLWKIVARRTWKHVD